MLQGVRASKNAPRRAWVLLAVHVLIALHVAHWLVSGRTVSPVEPSEDTPPRRKSFVGTLLHVATHGMHHRAQLLYMLRCAGVPDLPEGDALSAPQAVRGKMGPSEESTVSRSRVEYTL